MYTTANVTRMVTDFERSLRFYSETVGLEVRNRHGNGWAEVVAPGLTIGLHPTDGEVRPATDGSESVGLLVDNFHAAVDRLRSRGVVFSSITETDRASSAFFADPDGHQLYVMWRPPAPS